MTFYLSTAIDDFAILFLCSAFLCSSQDVDTDVLKTKEVLTVDGMKKSKCSNATIYWQIYLSVAELVEWTAFPDVS